MDWAPRLLLPSTIPSNIKGARELSSTIPSFPRPRLLMRILLLADIHGNWPALQAIDERYDVCLCLGDLVDYALDPVPCLDWVRQRAQYTVRGNHDHGVAQNVTIAGQNGFKYLTS